MEERRKTSENDNFIWIIFGLNGIFDFVKLTNDMNVLLFKEETVHIVMANLKQTTRNIKYIQMWTDNLTKR